MKLKDMVGLVICTGLIALVWVLLGEIGSGLYETRAIPFAVRFLHTAVYLLAFKTLWGFHFSWERCSCCGKKYGVHNKDSSGGYLTPAELEVSRAWEKKKKAELDAEDSDKPLANVGRVSEALKPLRGLIDCKHLYPPTEDVPRHHCRIWNDREYEYEGDCPVFLGEISSCRFHQSNLPPIPDPPEKRIINH